MPRSSLVLPPSQLPRTPAGGRVLVVTGSVGAGHDGAARELADRLRATGVEVDVRDLLAVLPAPVPRVLRDGYRLTVDRVPQAFEQLFRALERPGAVSRLLVTVCRLALPGVRGWLAERPYDLVVSTYPLASRCLGELRRTGRLAVPVVTYLTDPAAHASWLDPGVDLHLTVTAATARQGERAYGVPMREAGPLVPARFAAPVPPARRAAVRAALGLRAGARAALLVAGSLGLGDVVEGARDVAAAGFVPVVLCGRSAALRRQVAQVPGAVALGWRDDVHELMAACDVLVHNAGGLSFTEALVAGLPAVSYRCIPGHGRANAAVLDAAGLAPWARTPAELRGALEAQVVRPRRVPALGDPVDALRALLPAVRPLAA